MGVRLRIDLYLSLWFADEIYFDLRNIRGQKQSMLFMFDVVTGGMRVAFESSK